MPLLYNYDCVSSSGSYTLSSLIFSLLLGHKHYTSENIVNKSFRPQVREPGIQSQFTHFSARRPLDGMSTLAQGRLGYPLCLWLSDLPSFLLSGRRHHPAALWGLGQQRTGKHGGTTCSTAHHIPRGEALMGGSEEKSAWCSSQMYLALLLPTAQQPQGACTSFSKTCKSPSCAQPSPASLK